MLRVEGLNLSIAEFDIYLQEDSHSVCFPRLSQEFDCSFPVYPQIGFVTAHMDAGGGPP